MISLTYDLHLHSCLSPCGDADMTPGNIIGMSALKELDVIALTDHNTCKNCEAVMKLGEQYGILVIPGMELTTVEEVHVVCLFETLAEAMRFDAYVYEHLQPIENHPEIFGEQLIMDENDTMTGTVNNLLINATDISFTELHDLLKQYHGVMIPAHIDKNANSLLSNLGFVPPDSKFTCFELKNMANLHKLRKENPYLENCNVITDSDAHYLEHINEPVNSLWAEERSVSAVLGALKIFHKSS